MRRAWLAGPIVLALSSSVLAWGSKGHALGSRAAADALPEGSEPLAHHADALAYDGDEPDRWRTQIAPELDKAQAPDHYIDLECWGDPATLPADRWLFLKALIANDVKSKWQVEPELVGFAPYRVIELEEQLELQLAAGLRASGSEREAADELARTTAGVLGHYVLDLANPHHTTIHHNGWHGDNPHGFTTERGIHHLFETDFVERTVDLAAVESATAAIPRRTIDDVRGLVVASLRTSHDLVEPLYALEKEGAFARGHEKTDAGERGRAFAVARIAAGAADLRDLWTSALEHARLRVLREKQAREARRALVAAGFERARLGVRRDFSFDLSGWGDPADEKRRDDALAVAKKALPDGSEVHADARSGRGRPGADQGPPPKNDEKPAKVDEKPTPPPAAEMPKPAETPAPAKTEDKAAPVKPDEKPAEKPDEKPRPPVSGPY